MKRSNLQWQLQTLCCQHSTESLNATEECGSMGEANSGKGRVIAFKNPKDTFKRTKNKVEFGQKSIRVYLGLLLTIVKRLRYSFGHSATDNRFFSVEEQRKFELEAEMQKHRPHHLIRSSFIRRGDF